MKYFKYCLLFSAVFSLSASAESVSVNSTSKYQPAQYTIYIDADSGLLSGTMTLACDKNTRDADLSNQGWAQSGGLFPTTTGVAGLITADGNCSATISANVLKNLGLTVQQNFKVDATYSGAYYRYMKSIQTLSQSNLCTDTSGCTVSTRNNLVVTVKAYSKKDQSGNSVWVPCLCPITM